VPARGLFFHAYVVTALNPKSIAFFVAFVPQFVHRDAALMPQFIILEATFVTLAAINALVFALAADALRARIRRPPVLRWMNRTGAACLVRMGAATAALARQ
jgi:threonine/homoserine/homoserine lactone efflux protein